MKIKLIQTGGFLGRTKFAEEELTACSPALQQQLEQAFLQSQSHATLASPGASRDAFGYYVEYNDKSLPVQAIPPTPDFDKLLESLKAKLHY